jgi:hypothetical protein
MRDLERDWSNLDVQVGELEKELMVIHIAIRRALTDFVRVRSELDQLWEKVKKDKEAKP